MAFNRFTVCLYHHCSPTAEDKIKVQFSCLSLLIKVWHVPRVTSILLLFADYIRMGKLSKRMSYWDNLIENTMGKAARHTEVNITTEGR